jgi:hypothetical protein
MATPADLLQQAGRAQQVGGMARRPLAPKPLTGPPGTLSLSGPPPTPTLDGSAAGGAPVALPPSAEAGAPSLSGARSAFPGFRPMNSAIGGGAGMMVPPAPPPMMAQGRPVTEQNGQQGIMGAHGGFQPLGEPALRRAGAGLAGGVSSSYGGGSDGIIAEPELLNRGGGLGGFHPPTPAEGGGFIRPRPMTPNVADAAEPPGMSSIGQAVGRTMFAGRRPRSMVSRDGAPQGF